MEFVVMRTHPSPKHRGILISLFHTSDLSPGQKPTEPVFYRCLFGLVSYLRTPAGRGSLFLSEWACLHQAPPSLMPHNGPSLTPVSSWRKPPSCHLPPESCLLHLLLCPERRGCTVRNVGFRLQMGIPVQPIQQSDLKTLGNKSKYFKTITNRFKNGLHHDSIISHIKRCRD